MMLTFSSSASISVKPSRLGGCLFKSFFRMSLASRLKYGGKDRRPWSIYMMKRSHVRIQIAASHWLLYDQCQNHIKVRIQQIILGLGQMVSYSNFATSIFIHYEHYSNTYLFLLYFSLHRHVRINYLQRQNVNCFMLF